MHTHMHLVWLGKLRKIKWHAHGLRPVRTLAGPGLGIHTSNSSVNLGGFFRHGFEHGIRTQRIKVGTRQVERTLLCNDAHITDVLVKRKLARQRLQDVQLCIVGLCDRQVQETVEAARSQQRRV